MAFRSLNALYATLTLSTVAREVGDHTSALISSFSSFIILLSTLSQYEGPKRPNRGPNRTYSAGGVLVHWDSLAAKEGPGLIWNHLRHTRRGDCLFSLCCLPG